MPIEPRPGRPLNVVDGRDESTASHRPLRVAVIAPPWVSVPPVGYGGTESVIDTLCRGLRQAAHEVLLVTTADSRCPVERVALFEAGLGIGGANSLAELRHAAAGYAAAERWGADIVHDHTLSGPSLGATSTSIPVVTTCHGPFASDLADVYRLMSRHVPVIAISRSQAREADGVAVSAVIHHGIDLDVHTSSDLHGPRGDVAMFLGRMSPDKGVGLAIDVATRAGVPLVICAKMREPLEHEYFDEVVRPRLGPDVEFVGELDRSAQRELLRRARCLLNPIQWNEPFGLVAIEAMAAGAPVVTTPRGAMPEIVLDGRTGFVRESVDDLAAAVVAARELDPSDCRRRVEECFSMELMAANHVRFYRRVLAALPPGACRS